MSIQAILDDFTKGGLPMEIATAEALDVVHTAPAPQNVPAPQHDRSAVAIGGFGEVPQALAARLLEIRDELTATEKGRAYAAVIERHHEEARALVNTNKRVATVWRRSGGPEIVHAALAALQRPDTRLPETIGGRPFRDCVRRIAAIFTRYASPPFAADIARCEEGVAKLGGINYRDLVSALA